MKQINVRNRQRRFPVNSQAIRQTATILMAELLPVESYDLTILFVNESRMAELNQLHLHHDGTTDIITFDYSTPALLHGELVICPAVASAHATKFHVSLGREFTRYLIHGVLHLRGHDDQKPTARRKMKAEENRLLRQLARRFPLDSLADG
jgi:probable rRNA maturation factor